MTYTLQEAVADLTYQDRLGQISNMHKIRADDKPLGTLDTDCITLAKLASDAVDFSKSGIPVSLIAHSCSVLKLTHTYPGRPQAGAAWTRPHQT